MNKASIILILLVSTLVSCKKDLIEKAEKNQVVKTAETFKQIKTSEEFSWTTKKDFELSISGLKTPATITNTLKVSSVDGKSIYSTLFYNMETSSQIKVIVPSIVNEVRVSFGSINKIVKIESGKAIFDFIPSVTVDITE